MAAAILDMDGTLVDTNYHHAIAWFRAFRAVGRTVPMWELHRHVGMGGDQFVRAVAGEDFDRERGDEVRDLHSERYMELIDEVQLLPDARKLLETLKERGHTLVLASSAEQQEVDHYIELLDASGLADAWTTKDDVEATKPEPDLVQAAVDKAGGGTAVLVGDTPWDVEAAKKVGVETLAVLTGGFSEPELRKAGALEVFQSLPELLASLERTPLG